MGSGEKHRLSDNQNPRCIVSVELQYKEQLFTLLEVDTSDGVAKLSTMLLKARTSGWAIENLNSIRFGIMKRSLRWPTDYFKGQLGENAYKGIPHPPSKHSGSLPPEEIEPWAQRVANWIERTD